MYQLTSPSWLTYQVHPGSSSVHFDFHISRSLLNAIVRLVDGGSRIHHGGKEGLQILIASRKRSTAPNHGNICLRSWYPLVNKQFAMHSYWKRWFIVDLNSLRTWKWWFIVDLPSYNMVMFNSYVSLQEGSFIYILWSKRHSFKRHNIHMSATDCHSIPRSGILLSGNSDQIEVGDHGFL